MILCKLMRLPLLMALFAALAAAQAPHDPAAAREEVRLPNGKLQKDEILRADHEKSLEESAKLVQLTEELKADLEKNDRHVLSVSMLKKLDDIEKLTKRIRSRLKRY